MVQGDPTVSSDLVVRLYAVARGLEDEGQNNIAKLFRAAALGEMYRSSQNRARQGAGLEEELRDAIADLAGLETTSESLTAALFKGLEAFERGEWPTLSEIPATRVCRFCGEVMVGIDPDRCPRCNARPLTFHEVLPVFYLDPLTPGELRQALRSNLAEVERCVSGVCEGVADRGPWPMRDMMSHLLGAQLLMYGRARQMLTEDNPDLGSVAPTEVRAGTGNGPATMAEMLYAYRESRQELIDLAEDLSDEQFAQAGYHHEWGVMTVLSQLTYMVRHEQSHLAELEARRNGR
jgi:rubrerythrin